MRNLQRIAGAVAALSVTAAAAYWAGAHAAVTRGSTSSTPADRHEQTELQGKSAPQARSGAPAASSEDDGMRQALLRAVLLAGQPAAGQPAAPVVDSITRAREKLDERMANAAPDAANTTKMESALQALIDSGILGETRASLVCGASMCRVELQNGTQAGVQKAVIALAERTPKLFASTSVFPKGDTERAMYLTTNAADLMLAPPTDQTHVVQSDEPPAVR